MDSKPMRHVQVAATKSLFDELIDRHAEAYLEAYPEVKEFSNFEKSGTGHYYIGMIWASEFGKLDLESIKLRGSTSITSNSLVELDLSAIDTQQSFFPGQIIAFLADPFTKRQLTIRKLLDPMAIAPRLKTISTDQEIRLLVAAGPYMKPEQDDWILLDSIIEVIRDKNATHVILMGPFVDMENKFIRARYDVNWRSVFDKLCASLYDHECQVYLVPSSRDVLPHYLSATYFYPSPALDFEVKYREGIMPKCQIASLSDPGQVKLDDSIYLDVTSAEVLIHLNKCSIFINKQQGNTFTAMYRHLLSLGTYPIYPPPCDLAVDYPRLRSHIQLDRLSPHIMVLPTRFKSSVVPVDDRLVVAVQKCSTTKQVVLITIPRIDGSSDIHLNSVVHAGIVHEMVDLSPASAPAAKSESQDSESREGSAQDSAHDGGASSNGDVVLVGENCEPATTPTSEPMAIESS